MFSGFSHHHSRDNAGLRDFSLGFVERHTLRYHKTCFGVSF